MHEPFVLRSANVLDEAGSFSGPSDVHVAEGQVVTVGRNLRARGARPLDCAGLWLMPGVFDCHTHLALSSVDPAEIMRTPLTQVLLETARNARRTLEAGVTFVRDPAGADAGVRAAIEGGYVPGPRLQVAIVMLSQTGGHGDGFLSGAGLETSVDYLPGYPGRPASRVDGPEEMRRVVRAVLRAGADWVKLATTGGVLAPHDEGDVPEFTLEEIQVAVFEAARKGKGVMVHAFGGEGVDNAVRAGARSVEHGLFLSEEQAARMAEAGCFLVPTLLILREVIRWAEEGALPAYAERKALALKPRLGDAVRVAREHGVGIALGSDFVRREQHGRNLEEIPLLHEAGLTVEEALLAATVRGAELCGVADRYGRIAPGFVFDAVVLDEDPGDLALFRRPGAVTGVFKGGEQALSHPRLAASGG